MLCEKPIIKRKIWHQKLSTESSRSFSQHEKCNLSSEDLNVTSFTLSAGLAVSVFVCVSQTLCVISPFPFIPCQRTSSRLKRTSTWRWLPPTLTAVWWWSGITSKWISGNLTISQVCQHTSDVFFFKRQVCLYFIFVLTVR